MQCYRVYFVIFALWLFPASAESTRQRLNYFTPDYHTSHYVIDILKLGMSKNPALDNIQLHNINYQHSTESDQIALLERGVIDIFWDGTSSEREQNFAAVRIPLYKGLLGYRVFLTHKDNLSRFENIDESALKQLVACQGESWPDTSILEHNGYTVATASRFIQLIKLTNKKRCDYFPRAIYEGLNEINWLADKFPDLRLIDDVLLSYRLPIYLFVRKSDADLAYSLTEGLITAVNDGSFQHLFDQHSALKYLHPLEQWRHKSVFTLDNPTLPQKTPQEPAYWIDLKRK